MSAENDKAGAPDPGLAALVMLLRFHGVGADPEQIRHRYGGTAIGVPEMLRCGKGARSQSPCLPDALVASGADATAGDRGAARRRLSPAR
jgi:hypothetical protein